MHCPAAKDKATMQAQGPPERQLHLRQQLLGKGDVEQCGGVLKSTARSMLLELKVEETNKKPHIPRDECRDFARSTQDQFQGEHHHFFKSR